MITVWYFLLPELYNPKCEQNCNAKHLVTPPSEACGQEALWDTYTRIKLIKNLHQLWVTLSSFLMHLT